MGVTCRILVWNSKGKMKTFNSDPGASQKLLCWEQVCAKCQKAVLCFHKVPQAPSSIGVPRIITIIEVGNNNK